MSLVSWNGWCRWYKWYIFQSWWNIVWCRFGELWYLSMYREKLLRNLQWSRRSCRNHIWSSPSALVLRSDHMDLRNLKVIGCYRMSSESLTTRIVSRIHLYIWVYLACLKPWNWLLDVEMSWCFLFTYSMYSYVFLICLGTHEADEYWVYCSQKGWSCIFEATSMYKDQRWSKENPPSEKCTT